MPGVHCLQEIECFRSSHLAYNDSFGSHAQAISDKVTHGDLSRAFEIGRPRLKPHHMGLLELKLGRVLARDDSFIGFNIVREAVEQSRLAGASAARDYDIAANASYDFEYFCAR